jgi:hypothetical protein
VLNREAVLGRQAVGHQGAVAGLRVALHAEQGCGALGWERGDDVAQVRLVQDLARVAVHEGGRQQGAAALSLAPAGVLRVQDVPQLGRGRQLQVVLIADSGVLEGSLEALRVGPGVFRPVRRNSSAVNPYTPIVVSRAM